MYVSEVNRYSIFNGACGNTMIVLNLSVYTVTSVTGKKCNNIQNLFKKYSCTYIDHLPRI